MKSFMLLSLSMVLVSCSSGPIKIKSAASELYEESSNEICPGVSADSAQKKDAVYCLGWMYINSTDRRVPQIDQLAFKDIAPGDPAIPYLWVALSSGLVEPLSPTEFGSSKIMEKEEWNEARDRMKEKVELWEKSPASLRLK